MNKNNLNYIQQLSLMDPKSLGDKVLKCFEEGGELSGKVLPYTNAAGTLHRFVNREHVLEEVADLLLCARSIGYDLGFSHEEIEEKMMEKSKKWAALQQAESRLADKIPFEIHITVAEAEQQPFIDTCKLLDVKPIILALQAKSSVIKDVMTSSNFMGNNREALEEMARISHGLKKAGFEVLREKIETVPWHPAAPSREFARHVMPPHCYFESHLGIKMTHGDDDAEMRLKHFCKVHNLHLSKNAFKELSGGQYVIMATYRVYDGVSEDFKQQVERLHEKLLSARFDVEKLIIEFSIYDTKISHDSEWLKK